MEEDPPAPLSGTLAVIWQQNQLGFAFWVEPAAEMSCGQCFEHSTFLNLQALLFSFRPSMIVTPTTNDAAFIATLHSQGSDVKQLSRADFAVEGAKQRLAALPGNQGCDDIELGCAAVFGTHSHIMVRAVGGLLTHISQASPSSSIDRFVQVPVEGVMQVDVKTMEALQIFKTEQHPASHQGLGKPKEGLSLFGLLNRCRSPLGKALLRQWFLRPLTSLPELTRRLDAVEYFADPHRRELVAVLHDAVKPVWDPQPILRRLRDSKGTVHDWVHLARTLAGFQSLVAQAQATLSAPLPPILRDLTALSEEAIAAPLRLVEGVIDLPQSGPEGRLVVRQGVSAALDEYRRVYEGLDEMLTHVARQELSTMPPDFHHRLSVAYFPQIGYLLVVPLQYAEEHGGDPTIPGLTFHFMSDDYIYYKNPAMDALDLELGDIHGLISDLEAELVRSVADQLLQPATAAMLEGVRLCAELDCVLAFALVSAQHRYTRPVLTQDDALEVRNGRHPLQELCVAQFIPNDTLVPQNTGHVVIVTGPNSSGKSVYLKQVGLLTFMAHLGCFVPAERAVIGLRDRLFTRIRSGCAPADGITSAFAADILQVSAMLHYGTQRSLLLVDEFGKGTLPQDGVALLTGTLKHFLRRGPACPLTFVCTHYSELLDYGLVDPRSPYLQFITMQVLVQAPSAAAPAPAASPLDDIVFLFKAQPGRPPTALSFAGHCARMAGVPEPCLRRAEEVAQCWRQGRLVSRQADASGEEAEHVQREVCARFAAFDVATGDLPELLRFLQEMHARL